MTPPQPVGVRPGALTAGTQLGRQGPQPVSEAQGGPGRKAFMQGSLLLVAQGVT